MYHTPVARASIARTRRGGHRAGRRLAHLAPDVRPLGAQPARPDQHDQRRRPAAVVGLDDAGGPSGDDAARARWDDVPRRAMRPCRGARRPRRLSYPGVSAGPGRASRQPRLRQPRRADGRGSAVPRSFPRRRWSQPRHERAAHRSRRGRCEPAGLWTPAARCVESEGRRSGRPQPLEISRTIAAAGACGSGCEIPTAPQRIVVMGIDHRKRSLHDQEILRWRART
jgi:hypothetical protein